MLNFVFYSHTQKYLTFKKSLFKIFDILVLLPHALSYEAPHVIIQPRHQEGRSETDYKMEGRIQVSIPNIYLTNLDKNVPNQLLKV